MNHPLRPTLPIIALRAVVLIGLCTATVSVVGCKSVNEINTQKADAPVVQQAIQATLTVDSTATAATSGTAAPSVSPTSSSPAPGKVWPAKVGTFAKNFKGPVWFPTAVPAGMKIDALDVVELEPGSGLICDIVWYDGKNPLMLTQGSPKSRGYDIVSIGKVAWGSSGTADVVHEDPTDPTTAKMIVYNKDGNLAELSGVVDFETLKAAAASMVLVK